MGHLYGPLRTHEFILTKIAFVFADTESKLNSKCRTGWKIGSDWISDLEYAISGDESVV